MSGTILCLFHEGSSNSSRLGTARLKIDRAGEGRILDISTILSPKGLSVQTIKRENGLMHMRRAAERRCALTITLACGRRIRILGRLVQTVSHLVFRAAFHTAAMLSRYARIFCMYSMGCFREATRLCAWQPLYAMFDDVCCVTKHTRTDSNNWSSERTYY